MDTTKPFLKWVGGKTQIIDTIVKHFPNVIENYYEPFVGGGSVLLALLTQKRNGTLQVNGSIYASDLNPNLIQLYKTVQSKPDELINEVNILIKEYEACTGTTVNRKPTSLEEGTTSQESYYYWIRTRYNALNSEERKTSRASAMFLFLNKACFRGVYREGPRGFNVPFGHYKKLTVLDEQHIRIVSELLQDVVFTTASFKESLKHVKEGDFVYLDPPYAPETRTSFVGYTADGFDIDMHTELFTIASTTQAKMLMSNADVKLVTDAFPSPRFTVYKIECRRAIHSKDPSAKTMEVLITNESMHREW